MIYIYPAISIISVFQKHDEMKAKSFLFALLLLLAMTDMHAQNAVYNSTDTAKAVFVQFDPVAATQQYLDQLSAEKKERSDAYFEGGYWLILAGIIYEVIIAWIFLSLGLSRLIKKVALRAGRKNVQNLIYIALYFIAAYILAFPLTVYEGFIREHAFDLSRLSFGGWLGEEMIRLLLQLVLGSLVLMFLYVAIRKTKENWWKWGTGFGILFLTVMIFISPVFIDPLFNHYKPLKEGPVKKQILSLARANGVPADNVYTFNASKQSTRISANVSGIGSTIRISLNDNLLNRCTFPEIKSVMAHEIGHYVLHHTYKLILSTGLLMFFGFALVNWALKKTLSRWGERWKINGIADIGSLPLIMVLFSLFLFLATPAMNNVSRITELEADYYGLNAAREPDAFASAIMKLSEYRKINPGRWEEIIFYDHPSGRTRILNAMRWKAENLPFRQSKRQE
jgi:STE24 endopeptidase